MKININFNYIHTDLNNPVHLEALEQVAAWSAQRNTMKLYSLDDLARFALELDSVLAFTDDEHERFAGHVALTELTTLGGGLQARVGALAVAAEFGGNGAATGLVGEIAKNPKPNNFSAAVHEASLNTFVKNDFTIVGPRNPAAETGCNIIVNLINPYKGAESLTDKYYKKQS